MTRREGCKINSLVLVPVPGVNISLSGSINIIFLRTEDAKDPHGNCGVRSCLKSTRFVTIFLLFDRVAENITYVTKN